MPVKKKPGKCMRCGKPVAPQYKSLCKPCRDYVVEWTREKRGFKAWEPGGRGRPPL